MLRLEGDGAMTKSTVNAQRFDPYKNFEFRVFWESSNMPVAGISEVRLPKRSTEVVKHREGGDPRAGKSPGRSKYEAITLERGVTHDVEFERWANSCVGAEASMDDLRRNVLIEVYNEGGQLSLRYKVFRCWVSEYLALPKLDANADAVAIQHIKLENEGWERDYEVAEPRATSPVRRPSRRK
jgi:phage tail-like protein